MNTFLQKLSRNYKHNLGNNNQPKNNIYKYFSLFFTLTLYKYLYKIQLSNFSRFYLYYIWFSLKNYLVKLYFRQNFGKIIFKFFF